MTIQERAQKYYHLNREVVSLEKELDELAALPEAVLATSDYAELRRTLVEHLYHCTTECEAFEKWFDGIGDELMRKMLYLRFVVGRSVNEISVAIYGNAGHRDAVKKRIQRFLEKENSV